MSDYSETALPELTITSLADDGRGIARINSSSSRPMVVFVRNALPGQKVRARLISKKTSYLEAECELILEAGNTVSPPCSHAECGGCPLSALPYHEQCFWKEEILRSALLRTAHLPKQVVAHCLSPLEPSPHVCGYRNKMTFAFGLGEKKELLLGQRKASSHTIIETPHCQLMPPLAQQLVGAVRALAADSPYHSYLGQNEQGRDRKAQGLWRFLTVRRGFLPESREEAWWLLLLTSPAKQEAASFILGLGEKILQDFPAVAGFVHEERRHNDNLALGEQRRLVLGRSGVDAKAALLELPLGGASFQLDVTSFFQVNIKAAEKLAHCVVGHCASLANDADSLLDLFCGVGAPGLLVAPHFARTDAVEIQASSVQAARKNAERLQLSSYHCHQGSCQHILPRLEAPSLVLLDPPRSGLEAESAKVLASVKSRAIIYVSCNPQTLARDITRLKENYELAAITPIDLFPHTAHVESVSLLMGRGPAGL